MTEENNTAGREANSAQPLGQRHGTDSDKDTARTAEQEQHSAGPDGPDPTYVGETFKKQP